MSFMVSPYRFAAGSGMSPIQFVGAQTWTIPDGGAAFSIDTLTGGDSGVTASIQTNDIILLMMGISRRTSATGHVAPGLSSNPGFTAISTENTAVAQESSTYHWIGKMQAASNGVVSGTFNDVGHFQTAGAGLAMVFRGASNTLDVAVVNAQGAGNGNPNPPAVTPATAGALIVCAGVGGWPDGGQTLADPADLTNFAKQKNTPSYDVCIGMGLKRNWSSGAFDPAQWTGLLTGVACSWTAATIVLKP